MPTALTIISEKGNSVQTIGPEATILEATRKMNQHRIGALVVMSGNSVAGIFTERDVLQRVVGAELDPSQVTVGEVMTRQVFCAPPTTEVDELSEIMATRHVRHIPICNGSELMGMVSIGDVNATHASHQQATIHYLNDYIYGRA